MEVEVDLAGADGLGGQLQPVQDQVRGGPQQCLVLVAGRLALGAVADDDRGALLARDGRELAVGGERRTAASGQAGRLDGVDEQGGAATVGRLAVHLQVIRQVHRLPAGRQEPR